MSSAALQQDGSLAVDAVPGEQLSQVLRRGDLGEFRADSDFATCLMPLLSAIGWHGEVRHLAEALPHFANRLDVEGIRAVLANLNLVTHPKKIALGDLDPRLAPCLFQPKGRSAMVVLRREGDSFTVFDGASSTISKIAGKGLTGTAFFLSPADDQVSRAATNARTEHWFQSVATRFRGLVWQMAGITFITSLTALATPLFIMNVYDRVVSSKSTEMLYYLAAGVTFALLTDLGLRLIRGRLLAYLGARIDLILGVAAFRQVLHLPIIMTERASVGAQLSRLKQFEAVREFFTGPLAAVFLELPFVLIFVAVIAVIAGPLAWIPVVLICLFALVGLISVVSIRRRVAEASEARAERQSYLIEMFTNFSSVKRQASEATWSERHRALSARAAISGFRSSQVTVVVQTLAQTLMMGAGISTIALGTLLVMQEALSVGALIACMALVWRVLSPLQMGFLSFTRFEQVLLGLRQLNQLMRLQLERDPVGQSDKHRRLRGEITFNRVSLRYTPSGEPALLGAGLQIEQGEILAVSGSNGSGKSSLIKLVAGLYQAQAGSLLIDGIDIRQLDKAELRSAIAYVPQICTLFHGTIAQNLRLADPTASDTDLTRAVVEAGLMEEVLALPDGLDTRITDQVQRQLPKGFKQRLMLARAYVKDAPIYLLDEPANNLDWDGDQALMRKLQQLRGRATVIVVTHRPSHMRIADRVVYMEAGQIVLSGTPEDVLPKLGMA